MAGGFGKGRAAERSRDVSRRSAAGGAVERDLSALGVLGGGPLGGALHLARIAGGTHQRFLVPIRGDQNQRFRRAVLLDAPTPHSRPFRRGMVARKWLPHLLPQFTGSHSEAQRSVRRRVRCGRGLTDATFRSDAGAVNRPLFALLLLPV